MIPVFNALKIDCACFGNHDFDLKMNLEKVEDKENSVHKSGLGQFLKVTQGMEVPWVISNQPKLI